MIAQSLYRGLISLLHPRMLALMVLPLLAAGLVWLVAVVSFWGAAVAWIDAQLLQLEALQWMLQWWPLSVVATHTAAALLLLALVPVVLVLATILTGIFAMPLMVNFVAARSHAQLQKREGGSFAGGVWNSLAGCLKLLQLAVLTLPLWLLPPLWPILSVGLLGYLNQRVYPYDALAAHADAAELSQFMRTERWPLFWLGVTVALASHVPLLGFFAPVYGGLAYVHYCLARLAEQRNAPLAGSCSRVLEGGGKA